MADSVRQAASPHRRAGSFRARRGLAIALRLGLALIGVQCVQDLIVVPRHPAYEFTFTRDSADLFVGDTVAVRDSFPHSLTADGKPVAFQLDLTVTQGTDVVSIDSAAGRVRVLKRGTARVLARPLSTALVDTVSRQLTVHAVVARLTAAPETVLTSVNDSALLSAMAQTQGGADIPGVPVVWRPAAAADTTFVSLLDSTTGRVRAKADGVANFIGAVDNVTATRAVRVRQRPVSVVPDSTAITLRAVGRTRQLVAVARDARSAAVASASVAWRESNPTVAAVTPAGLVTALKNGNAGAISYVVRGLGDTVFGSPTAITVAQARLSVLGGDAQTGSVNTALPVPLEVQLVDAANASVADAGDTVVFTIVSGGGHLGASAARTADTILTDASGRARTTLTLGTAAGANTVTAMGTGLTGSPVTFTATGTAGAATQIAINGGNGQSVTVNTAVATAPSAIVRDQFSNPVAGVSVTFAVASGGGAVVPTTALTTNAGGIAQVTSWTLGTTAGTNNNTLTATSTGLTGSPVTFTATGTPGPARQLAFAVQPSNAVAGVGISAAVQVAVQDSLGNTVTTATTSVTVAITAGTGKAGANLRGTKTVSAVAGVATFAGLSIDSVGTGYTLAASATALTSGISTAFNITVGPVTGVIVSPAGATISTAAGTQTFSAVARDSLGNLVTGQTFSWAGLNSNIATMNSSTGVATAVASGQVTVSATVNGVTGYGLVTVAIAGAIPVNLWAAMYTADQPLDDVWGVRSNDVFAVGGDNRIVRFDGTSWNQMTTFASPQTVDAVWGLSSDNVYAVKTLQILHFDGTSWQPTESGAGGSLVDIWGTSPTDVFAVGLSGRVLHFDGLTWTPSTALTTQALLAVWGTSRANVYAAGVGAVVLRYDGSNWSLVSGVPTTTQINAIWGVSNSEIYFMTVGGSLLKFDGTTWTSLPPTGVLRNMFGFWASSSSDMYSVGNSGTILRYNGAAWTQMSSGTTEALGSVWGTSAGDLYAVGIAGTILRGVRGATVTVTPASPTLTALGATADLLAEARDGTGSLVSGVGWTWTSSNPGVATVDTAGVVTAVADGSATITAAAPGGASGTTAVTVSAVVWSDGFETYAPGSWPSSNWTNSGNDSGIVIGTMAYAGSRSFQLYGVVGGTWATVAHRSIGVVAPWVFECYVRNGSETIPSSGHQYRAGIDLHVLANWASGARGLISFHKDGRILDASGLELGTYQVNTWYRVTLKYEYPVSGQVRITYWINGSQVGQLSLSPASFESSLSFVSLAAAAGTAWFDECRMSRASP